MILPTEGAPSVIRPRSSNDYDAAAPVIQSLVERGSRFVAVSGIGLLSPGDTGQLNDGGPSAARTAIAYSRQKDEMYVFQGGNYTPDNIQDLFRGLGSDTAVLLDGGGSSAIVLRRDTGGMWAGAGSPGEIATPVRFFATPTSVRCRAGSRSTEPADSSAWRSGYSRPRRRQPIRTAAI
ncbi:hypothetical protein I553_8303 [Mycobacterium xenopi 4042]|uniref:Phosphodiester glycosidase domain-containing protein n=1 Tax=Mycobacterium xenopi 4042 TaxID=1299334 RepID=X8BJC3_MYCXE|nr:hypothetical protein I553_8303 [Mycobacterium xenopi 4042]